MKGWAWKFLLSLMALGFVLVLYFYLRPGKGVFRLSARFPSRAVRLEYSILQAGVKIHFKIRAEGGKVSVKSGSHRFVFPGFFLSSSARSVSFKNRFCGERCRISFHYFQPEFGGGRGNLLFKVLRKGKVVFQRELEGYNRVNFFSEAVNLKKGDLLVFEKSGRVFALAGRPVLSRARERAFVFLIGVDTLRRDSIGVYNPYKKCSPNIDRFSRGAVVFENAFSTTSWTLPAFTSVFTALYPERHGVNFRTSTIDPSLLLTRRLQEKFYTLAFTGDFFVSSRQNFYHGFDYFEESSDDPNLPTAAEDLFKKVGRILDRLPGRSFLFLHTYQLHLPYLPERELAREYYRKIGLKDGLFALRRLNIHGEGDFNKGLPEEKRARIFRDLYDAGVYTFDRRFGEFIELLKKRGIYRNSMIILFSDHGEEFAEHGGWTHGHTLYNELLRVPLIVKLPGQEEGKLVMRPVSIVDILPTVLRFYGLSLPQRVDGLDLLGGEKGQRLLRAYLAPEGIRKGVGGKVAYIFGEYKIIRNQRVEKEQEGVPISSPAYRGLLEVYNWRADPGERENLLRRVKDPEIIRLIKMISREKFLREEKRKQLPSELYQKLKTLGYN